MKRLRRTIRRILTENNEKMHASKLATLMGSGDLESINQGIELGDAIGMIDRHWTDEWTGTTIDEMIIFFHMICHKELAAKLREEIESKPYGENMFGFIGCEPGGTTVEYPDMPDFCKISFRFRQPAPRRN